MSLKGFFLIILIPFMAGIMSIFGGAQGTSVVLLNNQKGGIRNTIRTAENHQDPSSYWHQSSSLKSSSAGGRDDEEEGLKTGSSTINRRLKRRQQPQHAAAGTSAGDPRVIDLTSSGHQEKLVSDEQLDHQSVASMILTGGGAMNKPYFEAAWPQNVSVVLGQPIALKCRTRLLGDRMLSWIRQRDLHVLTSALVSYTSDGRFSVHHQPASDDWELRISSAQARDAGYYECQVNTEPKINWPVFLQVHTGKAQIAGPSEVHVRQGSTLSLSCTLRGSTEVSGPESHLSWYHDGEPILLETAKNSLSLATERGEGFLSSRLLLPRASAVDGGNYTCQPSEALPASVLVHVLNGEHPAAMQHGTRSGGGSCLPSTVQLTSILCLTYWTLDWIGRVQLLSSR